jgi:ribose-phosphate pyrophosphokinase
VQTGCEPVDQNLMELLLMIQAAKLASAKRITAVIPSFPYARQDRKAKPREPISARLVADMLQLAGADRVLTMDLHAGQIQGFFSIPGDVVSAFHIQVEYLKELQQNMRNPVVVTVDLGYAKKARNYAAALNVPLVFIEKRRAANDAKAQALSLIGDVNDRDVIIVDDEVDTGGSIAQAIKLVKEYQARNVYVVFVHPIFSLNAAERLAALPVTQFIATDSVPIPAEKASYFDNRLVTLSVSSLLGEVILRAHEGRSVGEMFNE